MWGCGCSDAVVVCEGGMEDLCWNLSVGVSGSIEDAGCGCLHGEFAGFCLWWSFLDAADSWPLYEDMPDFLL